MSILQYFFFRLHEIYKLVLRKNESEVFRVKIAQRKVTKCNTYNHSFFFIIVCLQFSIKFCFSGCRVLITNSKLVISVGKRRGFSRRLCELTREKFSMRQEQVNIIFIQSNKKVSSSRDIHSNENHSLLDNPLFLQFSGMPCRSERISHLM